jgi:RHS repeat-associated protein
VPAGASAEPLCTDTWTGASEGTWQTATNWSTGKVPTSSDVACIGEGKTVSVTEGANQTGVVQGKGALVLAAASLEVTNALETSSINAITMSGGTLSGAATVDVSGSFSWSGGTMSGTGSTVLGTGVSGSITSCPEGFLRERTLVNEGTVTLASGDSELTMAEGARLENKGTFIANAEVGCNHSESDITLEKVTGKPEPIIVNKGTFEKTEGTGTTYIEVAIANTGTIDAKSGTLTLDGGGSGGPESRWLASTGAVLRFTSGSFSTLGGTWEGPITIAGATATATSNISGTAAKLSLSSGSLSPASGSTATIGTLTMSGGTLGGAGRVNVSGTLSWSGGTMSGSGSTALNSGASGTVGGCSEVILRERTVINEGTMALAPENAELAMTEGARLENKAIFKANAQAECNRFHSDITLEEVTGKPNPVIVNSGTFEKTEGTETTYVEVALENTGTVNASSGPLSFSGGGSGGAESHWLAAEKSSLSLAAGTFSMPGGTWEGAINVGGTVNDTGSMNGHAVQLSVTGSLSIGSPTTFTSVTMSSGSLTMASGSYTANTFAMSGGTLSGTEKLTVSGTFSWSGGTMSGTGSTVLAAGGSGTISSCPESFLYQRTLVNEGTLTLTSGDPELTMAEGARLENKGTFIANAQAGCNRSESDISVEKVTGMPEPVIVNTGTFKKTEGTGTTFIEVLFENYGVIKEETGGFKFYNPVIVREPSTEWGGSENPSAPGEIHITCGKPVSCATGNESETQTDLAVGGRGVGLNLTRYYNSQSAAAGNTGTFGPGWSSSFSDHLVINKSSKVTTLYQADGSTVSFTEGTGGAFTAPVWTQDTLSGTPEAGYTLTLVSQVKYKFAGSSGRLESVTDRNGNATTLAYEAKGRLETITDPASRKITFAYSAEGLVESAKDPMGHTVKYTYEEGNLKSVTEPGEVTARWQFKYDGVHEITEIIDGRGGKTVNEYNNARQVISQKDPLEHKLTFEYEPFHTKITNTATGSITDERFTSNDEPFLITHGFGTASATTQSFTYSAAGLPLSVTDGNGHATTYEYDASSNKTKMVDPNKNETKWTYNTTHDVETMTTPKGEKTTIKRDIHGNPEVIERPAPESKTQTTKSKYATHGEVESVEDPLKRVWKYEYNTHGDRTSETDPEGNKRTWEYNEDSHETATVSPRGHVKAGEEAKYTTKIERDEQGRPVKVTDPLTHTTKYTYDGDGNLEAQTDGNSHTTKYTYNADNERTKVEAPNKAITETGYDGAGNVTSQIDGNKHETKYVRNILEQVTEVTDPLGHKTTKEYDLAGNLKKLTDPAKRTTTYTYDPANRLKEVVYSSGKPATIKYEYDKDGDRASMTDGTGTSKYTYDQLDRLTETETGHKEKSKYEYDLANEKTKITYPNTKAVTRAFDKDGRLEKVTDWSSNVTKFTYDPDSDQATTLFPTGTTNEDKYAYNNADQMSEVKMLKGVESLASLVYTRDNDGQVKTTTSKGLPGEEKPSYEYDPNSRLTKGATIAYEYDAANNITKIGTGTYKYNAASQLETGPSLTYTYDELGERTKTKPTTGSATTYGYNQAGNLSSVELPKEGEKAEIKDTYAYDGNGLRASQTINGTTSYLTWDMTESLPLILSDTTNSYIYGPGGLPVEQVSSGGAVTYLHHDQQGSTRLLTGSTGTATGSTTFDAYGNKTGSTGTSTTPLGYDGQYTSTDTGLIYLRARAYDPATGAFLTVDPIVSITGAAYSYAYDSPVNAVDVTGLCSINPFSSSSCISAGAGAVEEGAKAAAGFVYEHPVVISALGCTAGMLAGPEVCVGAVGASLGVSTYKNATQYVNGELSGEQVFAKQLLATAIAGVGAVPGLPLLGTAAGDLVEQAPVGIQLFVNGSLESLDAVLGILESNLSCAIVGVP